MGKAEAGRSEPASSRKEGGGHWERRVSFHQLGTQGAHPRWGGGVLMLDFGGDGPKSLLRSPAPTQHRVPHGENVLDMPPDGLPRTQAEPWPPAQDMFLSP